MQRSFQVNLAVSKELTMTDYSKQTTALWVGRTLSGLVALALFADAATILLFPVSMQANFAATGFPDSVAPMLGIIVLACTALYVYPRTAVLGAILVTGFLGGAICTHFRLGEIASPPQIISLLLGVMAWGGLYLRSMRMRSLLPVTS
jgi:hypothetical protein